MSDDLMEKVARAMTSADWNRLSVGEREGWRESALAALRVVREALAEPDEAMLAASWAGDNANETWRAMLAAHPIWRVE